MYLTVNNNVLSSLHLLGDSLLMLPPSSVMLPLAIPKSHNLSSRHLSHISKINQCKVSKINQCKVSKINQCKVNSLMSLIPLIQSSKTNQYQFLLLIKDNDPRERESEEDIQTPEKKRQLMIKTAPKKSKGHKTLQYSLNSHHNHNSTLCNTQS